MTKELPRDSTVHAPAAESSAGLAAANGEQGGAGVLTAEPRQPTAARPFSALDEMRHLEQVGKLPVTKTIPSWLFSALVHMAILVALGLVLTPVEIQEQMRDLLATTTDEPETTENLVELETTTPIDLPTDTTEITQPIDSDMIEKQVEISSLDDVAAAAVRLDLDLLGLEMTPSSDLLNDIGAVGGRGFEGRGEMARRALVAEFGGSDASEAAVARALEWFAAHQLADGSWSFDHRVGRCQGRCPHPGSLGDKGKLGATGLALLPFLGAGQTHRDGKYKEQVKAGLYYLVSRMKLDPATGGDLTDAGAMYSHGIAAIALCEAYAMTEDQGLEAPAQAALNFIMYAQDPVGGGWRYVPQQPGDTSVVGWQLMALKSGHMAYLAVHPNTIRGAENFLNSVQAEKGAFYGYTSPGNGAATTAIGLLSRMYLGWRQDNPALGRGVKWIGERGPSENDMYFNYYATQVMHHYEGPLWEKWNPRMRDYLVKTQAMGGHLEGSWFFQDPHGDDKGGRHYCTAMATMILEVYYRHLPIYQKQASDEEFDD